MKKTPLYNCHKELGAKLVPFAGWEMPLQYSGVIAEHMAVRETAGIFDVSHMGEIEISGAETNRAIDMFCCNDFSSVPVGGAQYSAITNEAGGIVDDVVLYRLAEDRVFICVNAANTDRVFEWINSRNSFNALIADRSAEFAQIALQGPFAAKIALKLSIGKEISQLQPFSFSEVDWGGNSIIVARTGYTGENGFEFFIPVEAAVEVWHDLLEAGAEFQIQPCGLGCRDTLRLEVCYPLHGHELAENITAIESGLGWIVKPDNREFIGQPVLLEQKQSGAPRSLIGFEVKEKGIVREGSVLFNQDGLEIGKVTSGTFSPYLKKAIGLALVQSGSVSIGDEVFAEVRGKKITCLITRKPFYKRHTSV